MTETLRELGIHSAFDATADYSSVFPNEKVFVDKATQMTKIRLDEKGIEGASCVEFELIGSGRSKAKRVHLTLNRPFVFALIKGNQIPIFFGVLKNPSE